MSMRKDIYLNRWGFQSIACAVAILASCSGPPNPRISPDPPKEQLLLNEFVAANLYGLENKNFECEDWLELYNNTADSIDLTGYFLSGDKSHKKKWQIPPAKANRVASKKRVLFWMDGDTARGPSHANFRIPLQGGYLALLAKDGTTVLDAVDFPKQLRNQSYGRQTDGNEFWAFQDPTPMQSNIADFRTELSPLPKFSEAAGFRFGPFNLALSADDGEIFFTTDGSVPTPVDSLRYKEEISINKSTVVRAITITEERFASDVVTKTYLISENTSSAVICLSSSPDNLLDFEKGIEADGPGINMKSKLFEGANYWKAWNRPAHFEYFSNTGEMLVESDVLMKIAGFSSRIWKKKSYSIKAHKQFESSNLDFAYFEDKPYDKHESLFIRADVNSSKGAATGQRIRNELVYHLNRAMGSRIGMQAYKPVILFINGEYRGQYTLLEKKEQQFIENNFGEPDCNIIDRGEALRGSTADYDSFINYLNNNNLASTAVYDSVKAMLNIDNYIDVEILYIFFANRFPSNTRYWKPQRADGKWNFIAYDFDYMLPFKDNTLQRYMPDAKAKDYFLLSRLTKNQEFRNQLLNRLSDCLNTALLPQNIIATMDTILAKTAGDKLRDFQRWSPVIRYADAQKDIAWHKQFFTERPKYIRGQFLQKFNLSGVAQLRVEVDNLGAGTVRVNSIMPAGYPWHGEYFTGIPLELQAIPNPGHIFVGWVGADEESESETISVVLSENRRVVARFQ